MSQLRDLSRPFKSGLVKKAPQGKHGDYVGHSTVNEKLLAVLGPFDFEIVEPIRGHAPEVSGQNKSWPARDNAIVGCLARLTVTIDGRVTVVQEVGTEDNPAMHNDAENLKNAASAALKRCAMRLGVGLHLWSQQDYFLYDYLAGRDGKAVGEKGEGAGETPEPQAPSEAGGGGEEQPSPPPAEPAGKTRCDVCRVLGGDMLEESGGRFVCRDQFACTERAEANF